MSGKAAVGCTLPVPQTLSRGPETHVYKNTSRHTHRMWTCRCTLNTCTPRSFLYLTDTYIHSSYVTKKKKKNECEWLLAFQVLTIFSRVKVTYQSVGFQRGQFILQTSPQPWLTSVPTNWVTKLMGCLLINKFSTCKHHYVTVLDHLLLKPLIQM